MSSISSIGSLLSQYLLGVKDSSSADLTELLADVADSDSTDTVSLSSESLSLLSSLLDSLNNESSGSQDSTAYLLDSLSSGSTQASYSSDSIYDILMSAANTRLLKSNPDLVNMIMAVEDAESSENTSSSTNYDTSSTEDIDLITMNASDILSIIEKYKALSESSSSATTSSQVDETV